MLPLILATGLALAGEPVKLSGPAWAFTLPSLTEPGRNYSLYDFTGLGAPDPHEAVVVHFFGPGGGDELVDELSELARSHSELQVLGIVHDPRGESAAATRIRTLSPDFPVLSDAYRIVFSRYDVGNPPFTMVVDRDGLVFAATQPQEEGFKQAIEEVLDRLYEDY